MSLRRNALLMVPAMLGCWSLKPADEVPDGGAADVARIDGAADVSLGDVADARPADDRVDAAAIDAPRADVGTDVGIDAPRADVGTDAGIDARADIETDARADAFFFDRRVEPLDQMAVDVPLVFPSALRLIGPPGLSTVSDRSPTLVWSDVVSGARLRVCRDRRCADVVYDTLVSGLQHAVLAALNEGVYFWNLRRPDNGAVLTATWQFRVLRVQGRRAGVPTGVTHRDMDNDGFVDIALSAPGQLGSGTVGSLQVHFGGSTVAALPALTRSGTSGAGGQGYGWRMSWGDFNRDNLADLAVGIFDPTLNRQGRIEILQSTGRAVTVRPTIFGANPTTDSLFATSIASGDLNGDGYDDLAATTVGGRGQLQVHLGGANGLAATPVAVPGPLTRPSVFGTHTAVLGDVDGDGFGDLLVSDACDPPQTGSEPARCAPTVTEPLGPSARIHIYFGRENWTAVDVSRVTIEGAPSGRLGRLAAPAGDLNSDGYADFVVSATTGPNEDTTGVVHVYLGRSRAAWMEPVNPHRTLAGSTSNVLLGASLAALDVNRDGRTDILAGAPGRVANAANDQGSVLVWLANTSGGYDPAAAVFPATNSGGLFGEIVASVGDVNGDGWGDLVVTAPLSPGRTTARGEAYLWTHASGPFPGPAPTVTFQGQSVSGWLGRGMAR